VLKASPNEFGLHGIANVMYVPEGDNTNSSTAVEIHSDVLKVYSPRGYGQNSTVLIDRGNTGAAGLELNKYSTDYH